MSDEFAENTHYQDLNLSGLIADRLDAIRKKLLDASRRNSLVHYRVGSDRRAIRVVDELPEVLRFRLENGERFQLASLPATNGPIPDEQTDGFQDALKRYREQDSVQQRLKNLDAEPETDQADLDELERELRGEVRHVLGLPERRKDGTFEPRQWAHMHGINPNFTLPTPSDEHDDGRHGDDRIQTMLLPEELVKRGKALADQHKTIERETGVGALHIVLGFLEWKPPSEANAYLSPLVLMEIQVERRNTGSGPVFHISDGDNIQTNTTLAVKLLNEHGIKLEKFGDQTTRIEDYFQMVSDAAPTGWDWQVKRQVTMGLFRSSSLAMYYDLDPTNMRNIEHKNIKRLLGTTSDSLHEYAGIYDTDDPALHAKVPNLVMDADPSQYAALIDAADGKDIAIEGPPGSGKSQTIVNLVAAAISSGKKVLFVAEKLTALDVVSSRLNAIGLGAFVLQLQPGSKGRQGIYQSIQERLDEQDTAPRNRYHLRAKTDHLEMERQKLQDYVNVLNSRLGQTGMTVYQILGHAVATSSVYRDLPSHIRRLSIDAIEEIDEFELDNLAKNADQLDDQIKQAGDIPPFWRDVKKIVLNREAAHDCCEDLAALLKEVDQFTGQKESLKAQLQPIGTPNGKDQIDALVSLLHNLPDASQSHCLNQVSRLLDADQRAAAAQKLALLETVEHDESELSKTVLDPRQPSLIDDLNAALNLVGSSATLDQDAIQAEVAIQSRTVAQFRQIKNVVEMFPQSLSAGKSLGEFKSLTKQIQALDLQALRSCALGVDDLVVLIKVIRRECLHLNEKELNLQRLAPRFREQPYIEFKRHLSALQSSSLLSFLSSEFREAKRFCKTSLAMTDCTQATMLEFLIQAIDYLEHANRFENDPKLIAALGGLFSGRQTEVARLKYIYKQAQLLEKISNDFEVKKIIRQTNKKEIDAINDVQIPETLILNQLDALLQQQQSNQKVQEERLAKTTRLMQIFKNKSVPRTEIMNAIELATKVSSKRQQLEQENTADPIWQNGQPSDIRTALVVANEIAAWPKPELLLQELRSGTLEIALKQISDLGTQEQYLIPKLAGQLAALGIDTSDDPIAFFEKRADDMRNALNEPGGLIARSKLHTMEDQLSKNGFSVLIEAANDNADCLVGQKLGAVLKCIVYRRMADRVCALHQSVLAGSDGGDFERIQLDVSELDRALIKTASDTIKSTLIAQAKPPAGNSVGKKSSYTESALIRYELKKQKRRIGVRQLIKRSGQALLELKPIWTMSPLAVAQYLENITFDLVVIDEASQMMPEAAIGAIKRADQMVVVGDTKQLPPTNFFRLTIDDQDTDEDLEEESESILALANACYSPVRQLSWHYRSEHSSLINFSNHHMYSNKLTIFPSANEHDPELGVCLKEVDGITKAGCNVIEAEAIVKRAVDIMTNYPDRSLGIATMNATQRDKIIEIFDRERDQNVNVRRYESRWLAVEQGIYQFFIRNLETVQGDERDIILISTVYGPEEPGGRVFQRFGPINSQYGHRRLNVLFTRAKKRIETFTSLKPSDIHLSESSSKGVRLFQAWLEYSASGQLGSFPTRHNQFDSPFEAHVAEVIEGLNCEPVAQVGVAGFRIDLGVKHPDWPYGYILGVECDGATYHSTHSSRVNDRLRQQILERQGWRIYRIWSTDWFNDPVEETRKLKIAVQKALQYWQSNHVAPTDIPQPTQIAPNSDTEVLINHDDQDALPEPDPQPNGQSSLITLGSIVELEQLDQQREKLRFTIVPEPTSNVDQAQVGDHSPLGAAILGAEAGDEIEYQAGSYVRYVRILAVT